MTFAIALIDLLAACLFFAAAVVTIVTSSLTGGRTRLWRFVSAAFIIFAVERGMNALEWGASSSFAWLDTFQGYVSTAACLLLVGAVLDFWLLLRKADEARAQ